MEKIKVEQVVRRNGKLTDYERVFSVTVPRGISDYKIKKQLIQWVMYDSHKIYRRLDPLRVKRIYQRPHMEMNFINQQKYLFILYNQF